jgi:hypothetical protein
LRVGSTAELWDAIFDKKAIDTLVGMLGDESTYIRQTVINFMKTAADNSDQAWESENSQTWSSDLGNLGERIFTDDIMGGIYGMLTAQERSKKSTVLDLMKALAPYGTNDLIHSTATPEFTISLSNPQKALHPYSTPRCYYLPLRRCYRIAMMLRTHSNF